MYPNRETAILLLKKAEKSNPGEWVKHSFVVAENAEKIASACGIDAEKAFICGLLHDIGRHFGFKHFGHIVDGYKYMNELGYDEIARICLTHSFPTKNINEYIGNFDVSDEEINEATLTLQTLEFDDFDILIQLCDAISGTTTLKMEDRMADVKTRYGNYPEEKWQTNLNLKKYFDKKCGCDIYKLVGIYSD